jgi:hypothetical protein
MKNAMVGLSIMGDVDQKRSKENNDILFNGA